MRPHGDTAYRSGRIDATRCGWRPSQVRFACRLKIVFYLLLARTDGYPVRAPSKRDSSAVHLADRPHLMACCIQYRRR